MKTRHAIDATGLTQLLLVLLIVGVILAIFTLASVPPVDRDALTHHLFIPKLYLQHGGIYEIPEILFSYYPMNLDLLYMIPLYFGNDIVPKYIHFFFSLLTSVLVYYYLKPRTSLPYALLGSLFFLSIPNIIKLSISAYVDLGLVFFSTASLFLVFRWLNNDYKIRHLLLAGICSGLAAGVKYNGIITIVILTLIVPYFYIRSSGRSRGSDRKSLGYCFVFIIMVMLTFSPWLIKNYMWTGNPIYPLHNSFFNPSLKLEIPTNNTNLAIPQSNSDLENPFVLRKILYKETWWQTLLLPVRFFFEGEDDKPQFFDGKLNPFLLFLPMLAFIRKAPSSRILLEKQALLLFAVLFFFFTFFQQVTRIRYIVSMIPSLVILSMFGLQNLFILISEIRFTSIQNFCKICVCLIPVTFLSYNFGYLLKQFKIIHPLAYLSGEINRDQYISYFRPEYPAIQFLNKLPEQTKTLAIFLGNRGYYFDKPVQFDLQDASSLIFSLVKNLKNEKQISEEFQRQNISHFLVNYDLFKYWTQKNLDPEEIKRLNDFFLNKTKLLFEANGHGTFQLIN